MHLFFVVIPWDFERLLIVRFLSDGAGWPGVNVQSERRSARGVLGDVIPGAGVSCRCGDGFVPSAKALRCLHLPTRDRGIHVRSNIERGSRVSICCSPVVTGMIIEKGSQTRTVGLLSQALGRFLIIKIHAGVPLLEGVVRRSRFGSKAVSAKFVDSGHSVLFNRSTSDVRTVTVKYILRVLLYRDRGYSLKP